MRRSSINGMSNRMVKAHVKTRKLFQGCCQADIMKDVFALLVPSCCDKSGKSQIVPTRLIQAVRKKLLRACCHQLVTCRRYQTCWNNLLRVCWPHQPCYKMITCSRLVCNWEQAVRTHLVDNLGDFHAWLLHERTHFKIFVKHSKIWFRIK